MGRVNYVHLSGRNIFAAIKRRLPLAQQARWAARVLPPGARFRFALGISRLQGRLAEALGHNGALTEAMMRDHWLRELTFHGPFPVPYRVRGREVLDRYAVPGPALYVTTHLPLGETPLRVAMEMGYPVPLPIADPGRIVEDERYVVTGMAERIPALVAGPYVLARMRTLLRRGTSVVCLADNEFAGTLSANPMRLAGRLGVPVLLVWAELAEDGVLDITFRLPPHPACKSEEAIAENMRYLEEINGAVLRSLGVTSPQTTWTRHARELQAARPAAGPVAPQTGARPRSGVGCGA